MSPLLISLGTGVLIGAMYALLKVQSPAPPFVALVGLLGMVIGSALGEQLSNWDVAIWSPFMEHAQSAKEMSPPLTPSITKKVE